MIKAIVFDMDGVLIDSEPANLALIADFFQAHGKCASESYLHSLVGRSAHDTWDLTAAAWGDEITYEAYHEEFQKYWEEHPFDYPTILMPHVKELLIWLKEHGYRIAVASSSRLNKIKEVLQVCEIIDYFDVIISGEQCTKSKPDPEIYVRAAELLELPVSECLAVEDSKAGIASCVAAHMKVVARVDTRFGANPEAADFQIYDMMDLIQICEQYR